MGYGWRHTDHPSVELFLQVFTREVLVGLMGEAAAEGMEDIEVENPATLIHLRSQWTEYSGRFMNDT